MKVSIIVPYYNGIKYYNNAKENFAQFYNERYELIFVDDGSSDELSEQLKEIFPKATFIYQENQGAGIARNNGITHATCEYTMFCDIDDVLHARNLEKVLDTIKNEDILIGKTLRTFYKNDKLVKKVVWKPEIFKLDVIFPKYCYLIYTDTVMHSKIFKTSILKDVYFPTGKYEDKVFLFELYEKNPKIKIQNIHLYDWRVNIGGNSQTNVKDINDLDQRFTTCLNLIKRSDNHFLINNTLNHDFMLYAQDYDKYNFEFKQHLYKYLKEVMQYEIDANYLSNDAKTLIVDNFEEFDESFRIINKKRNRSKMKKVIGKARTITFKNAMLLLYQITKKPKQTEIWVFSDRFDKASDNAEVMYRYVRDNTDEKIVYIIKKGKDYERLKKENFNLIEYGSLKHYITLFNAKYLVTSHIDNKIIYPWGIRGSIFANYKYKMIFLQHGIVRSSLAHWFNLKKFHIMTTTTKEEYNSIVYNGFYNDFTNNVFLTGLARHDDLVKNNNSKILFFPSWRSYLENNKNAHESLYFKNWCNCLKAVNKEERSIEMVLHSSITILTPHFEKYIKENKLNVKISFFNDIESFSKLISNSAMLITDFSSISFDFLYLQKPVIYFNFEEDNVHYLPMKEEDYDKYKKMGYFYQSVYEIENQIDILEKNNFIINNEKQESIEDYFEFSDQNNCKRIYNCIKEKE